MIFNFMLQCSSKPPDLFIYYFYMMLNKQTNFPTIMMIVKGNVVTSNGYKKWSFNVVDVVVDSCLWLFHL